MGRFDSNTVGRSKKATDVEILREIAVAPAPVVTASELAEVLPYSTDGVRLRLKELEEDGLVESREVGARAVVWWLTTDGKKQAANY